MSIIDKLEEAPVTDSLERSEDPLSNGGIWNKPSWDTVIGKCDNNSNLGYKSWRVIEPFTSGADGARLDDASFLQKIPSGRYVYTIGSISIEPNNQIADRWYALWTLMDASAESGYRCQIEMEGTGKYVVRLERADAGSYTTLASQVGYELSTSANTEIATFAIVVGEGDVYLFVKKPAGEYEEVLKAEDSTYAEGFGGMEGRGNFMRLRNFRVGTFELGGGFLILGAASGQSAASLQLRNVVRLALSAMTGQSAMTLALKGVGVFVKVKTAEGVKEAKRWIKVGGELLNR